MDKRDSVLESEIIRAKAEYDRLIAEKKQRAADRAARDRALKQGGVPWWAWAAVALSVAAITWLAVSVL